MPQVQSRTITSPKTGRVYTYSWDRPTPPTDDDLDDIIAAHEGYDTTPKPAPFAAAKPTGVSHGPVIDATWNFGKRFVDTAKGMLETSQPGQFKEGLNDLAEMRKDPAAAHKKFEEQKKAWEENLSSPSAWARSVLNEVDPTGTLPGYIDLTKQFVTDVKGSDYGGAAADVTLAALPIAIAKYLKVRAAKKLAASGGGTPPPAIPFDEPAIYPQPMVDRPQPQLRLPAPGQGESFVRGPRTVPPAMLGEGTPFSGPRFLGSDVGQPAVDVLNPANFDVFGHPIQESAAAQGRVFGTGQIQPGIPVTAEGRVIPRQPANRVFSPNYPVIPEVLPAETPIPAAAKPVKATKQVKVVAPNVKQPVAPVLEGTRVVPISEVPPPVAKPKPVAGSVEAIKAKVKELAKQAKEIAKAKAAEAKAKKAQPAVTVVPPVQEPVPVTPELNVQAANVPEMPVLPPVEPVVQPHIEPPKVEPVAPVVKEPVKAKAPKVKAPELPKVEPVAEPVTEPAAALEHPHLTDVERQTLADDVQRAKEAYQKALKGHRKWKNATTQEILNRATNEFTAARKAQSSGKLRGAVEPKPVVAKAPELPPVEPVELPKAEIPDLKNKTVAELREIAKTADEPTANALREEFIRRRKESGGGTTLSSGGLGEASRILKQEFDEWRVLRKLPENQEAFDLFLADTGRFVSKASRAAAGQNWAGEPKKVKLGERLKPSEVENKPLGKLDYQDLSSAEKYPRDTNRTKREGPLPKVEPVSTERVITSQGKGQWEGKSAKELLKESFEKQKAEEAAAKIEKEKKAAKAKEKAAEEAKIEEEKPIPEIQDIGAIESNFASTHKTLEKNPATAPIARAIVEASDSKIQWIRAKLEKMAEHVAGLGTKARKQLGIALDTGDMSGLSPDMINKVKGIREVLEEVHAEVSKHRKVGKISDYFTHMSENPEETFGTKVKRLFKGEKVKAAEAGLERDFHERALGDPDSPYTKKRTGKLENIDYDVRNVLPRYLESISKVIFDEPAVNIARKQLDKLPKSKLSELAKWYIKNYTRYDTDIATRGAFKSVTDAAARVTARSFVDWNLPLHMLHLGEVPTNIYPEIGGKYTLHGIKEVLKDPAKNWNEISKLGLIQGEDKPWAFKNRGDKYKTAAYFFNGMEKFVKGVGYNGAKQMFIDKGFAPEIAARKALELTKDMTLDTGSARQMKGLSHRGDVVGGTVASRLGGQFKAVPAKIAEQMFNIAMNAKRNPGMAAKMAAGAGAAMYLTRQGAHMFHLNPSSLLSTSAGGATGTALFRAFSAAWRGDYQTAMEELVSWFTPGGQAISKAYDVVADTEGRKKELTKKREKEADRFGGPPLNTPKRVWDYMNKEDK